MNKNYSRSKKIVMRNKRRKAVRTVFGVSGVCIIACLLFFAGFKSSAVVTGAKELDSGHSEKLYKSVMIEQNDCLWDIAERYMGVGYSNTNDYVAEIMQINNLSGSDIHYGEYLCIPYYG